MTTTCKPCGSTFGGQAQHCCACHATFSGTTAGDKHRVGDHAVSSGPTRRRCLTPAEMLEKGMSSTPNAQGTPIWRNGAPLEAPFWASPLESAGLAATPWGNASRAALEALESEVSA